MHFEPLGIWQFSKYALKKQLCQNMQWWMFQFVFYTSPFKTLHIQSYQKIVNIFPVQAVCFENIYKKNLENWNISHGSIKTGSWITHLQDYFRDEKNSKNIAEQKQNKSLKRKQYIFRIHKLIRRFIQNLAQPPCCKKTKQKNSTSVKTLPTNMWIRIRFVVQQPITLSS